MFSSHTDLIRNSGFDEPSNENGMKLSALFKPQRPRNLAVNRVILLKYIVVRGKLVAENNNDIVAYDLKVDLRKAGNKRV